MAEEYIAPKRTQKRYEQRFRDAWLQNPLLKDWLRDCYTPEGVREARCIYCDIRLCPRFIDLSKHAMTRKHLRNTPHEGSYLEQTSDIEETLEYQAEVDEDYTHSDHKNQKTQITIYQDEVDDEENDVSIKSASAVSMEKNITYEVILDHPPKDDVMEHQHQEETSLEHQFHAQIQDVSGHSSAGGELPLKIIKSGFNLTSSSSGENPSGGHKEMPQVNPAKRKIRMVSNSNEANIILERKKLVLQIKNEELRAYKLQLEAFKMERELGFGRSIFTKNLPTKTNYN